MDSCRGAWQDMCSGWCSQGPQYVMRAHGAALACSGTSVSQPAMLVEPACCVCAGADELEQLSDVLGARLQQGGAAAPEPLRSKLSFATSQLVQYIQRAHDLVLAGGCLRRLACLHAADVCCTHMLLVCCAAQ